MQSGEGHGMMGGALPLPRKCFNFWIAKYFDASSGRSC